MKQFLKKARARIKDSNLEVNLYNDGYKKINLLKYNYCEYSRTHIVMNNRISEINNIKAYFIDKTKVFKLSNTLGNNLDKLNSMLQILKNEQELGLKYGDYVEFKHFDEVVRGYIEEPYVSNNTVITNIEREQFSAINSWGNYIVKGVELKDIKKRLIKQQKAKIAKEFTLNKNEIQIALKEIANIKIQSIEKLKQVA